jgi:rod shape-determining protein MreD
MIFYILLPVLLLTMVVFQATILDNLFWGKAGVELALISVIYAGLRIRPLPGGLLSLLVGYLMDCVTGSLSGLHALTYVVIFFVAKLYFFRIHADRMTFIAFFCFAAIFIEGLVILIFYRILYDFGVWESILRFTLPQALVGGVLSPVIFKIFHFVEDALGYGSSGPFERA